MTSRLLHSLFAALAASEPAPEPTPPTPGAETTAQRRIPVVIIETDARSELLGELRVRLPGRQVTAIDDVPEPPPQRFALVQVSSSDPGGAGLRLILSDGRAYERRVDAPPQHRNRAIAGAVSNMLDAIEHNELEPREVGVKVQLREPSGETAAPVPPAPPRRQPPGKSAERADAIPRWMIGPELAGTAAFGIGPPTDLDGYVGAGGALGLWAIHDTGATVGAEARALTVSRSDVRLVRIRVGVGAGYVWRRRWFELSTRVGVAVEPLVIRDRGRRADLLRLTGGSVTAAPLIGGWARLSPGYFAWVGGRRTALRVALDVELAGSAEARGDSGAVRLLVPTSTGTDPTLRAGGLELGIGVSVAAWFGVTPAART